MAKRMKVRVDVDDNGNVEVTWDNTPDESKQDTVEFSSNRKDTAIKFKTSPVAEYPAGAVMGLDTTKGPYLVIRKAKHHIDCGHVVGGTFERWAVEGSDIPIPC